MVLNRNLERRHRHLSHFFVPSCLGISPPDSARVSFERHFSNLSSYPCIPFPALISSSRDQSFSSKCPQERRPGVMCLVIVNLDDVVLDVEGNVSRDCELLELISNCI